MMARTSLPPGFRFHPTDVELVWYYLKRKNMGKPFRFKAISDVELYKFAPWDLPAESCLASRDLEWYFFCPRDKKYSSGCRTNRATEIGYWKTTGRDRPIVHNSQNVGMKRTLIFHLGKVTQGTRTDWVMYEYRLDSKELADAGCIQDAYVLCKIFQKSGSGPRIGEQYGAPLNEDDWENEADIANAPLFSSISSTVEPQLPWPVPLAISQPSAMQSNFEIGESSAAQSASEIDEHSGVPKPCVVGERSSIEDQSTIGEPFQVPELPFEDGISLDLLEAYLNISPPHLGNANGETYSAAHQKDATEAPLADIENIFSDLVDLCVQPLPEPMDGMFPSENGNHGNELRPTLAEFAAGDYMELSDIGFQGDVNSIGSVAPYDYSYYPVAQNPSNHGAGDIYSHGLDDIYIDTEVDNFLVNESLWCAEPAAPEDNFSTCEDRHLSKGGTPKQ